MANVTETPSFDAGIYQIETTDPVLGGVNGIANAQAKGLANRTAFLKQQIDQLNSGQFAPSWIASQTYVQGELQKLDAKQSVRAATVANITLSGAQAIDGVTLTVGDRVLVKDQTTAAQNGIYLVAAQSWTRAADADNGTKLSSGARVAVDEGTVNAGKVWYLATAGAISIGSTALLFKDEHPDATQLLAGVSRFATESEAIAGLLSSVAVAPKEMKAAMEALLDIVAPIGVPIPWVTATPPNSRFLLVQAQSFDKAAYPKLADLWPTGVIPFDMRGEFPRGWDNGRGVDAGRVLLSAQADQFQGHARNLGKQGGGSDRLNGYINVTQQVTGIQSAVASSVGDNWITKEYIGDGVNGTPRVGLETRPRSIALNYIMRAA